MTRAVRFRNYGTPENPLLTGGEVSSMVGQEAVVLARPGDWTSMAAKAKVVSAAALSDRDFIRLGIEIMSGRDPFLDDDRLVSVGYVREPGNRVRLMEIGLAAPPLAIPSDLTAEMRHKGRQMMRECGYEVPQPRDHYPDTARCRREASSQVETASGSWQWRCMSHEGRARSLPDGGWVPGRVAPISLVPYAGDMKLPTPDWIIQTPWWRLSDGEGDPQNRDLGGRDFYDVLCEVQGEEKAAEAWRAACALDDRPDRLERIDRGRSTPVGDTLKAGGTVTVDQRGAISVPADQIKTVTIATEDPGERTLREWAASLNDPTLDYAIVRARDGLARARQAVARWGAEFYALTTEHETRLDRKEGEA